MLTLEHNRLASSEKMKVRMFIDQLRTERLDVHPTRISIIDMRLG